MAVSKSRAKTALKKQPARTSKKTSTRFGSVQHFSRVGDFFKHRTTKKPVVAPQQLDMKSVIHYMPFFTALAIVAALLLAYAIGRGNTNCAHTYSSNVGTVKVLTVMLPNTQNPFANLFSFLPYAPQTKNSSSLVKQNRAIIVDPQGNVLTIVTPNPDSLLKYDNKNVILTGQVSPCTRSVTLDTLDNITQLFTNTQ